MNDTHDWARQMGERRGRRDRAASLKTQTLIDLEYEQHAACLQRWPTIVAAMRALVESYNDGAGLAVVTLAEDPVNPSVTLGSVRNGQGSLVITLDGKDVSVGTRREEGDLARDIRWVSLDRTNENAAEYLLRDWMERL